MADFVKFRADGIFTGKEMLGDEHVLIIHRDGSFESITDINDAGDDIQQCAGILSPAFINAHCHLELSHMKGWVNEGLGMTDFLLTVMTQRTEAEEIKQQAMKDAEAEMWRNGIVAVGDICNTPDSFALKQASRLSYYNFIEVTGFVPATAQKRFDAASGLYKECASLFSNCSLSPHAPYSVSPQLFDLIFAQPQNVVTMHNQESKAEQDFFISKTGGLLKLYEHLGIDISFFQPTGKSSLQSVAHHFKNMRSLLLVHDCYTGAADIEVLKEYADAEKISFCLCPNANEHIGNPLPDIELLINSGMNICLGTDSLASNNQLNIWSEAQTIQRHYPNISTETLLKWATINSAKALKMDDQFGSFEKGKKPGVVLINNNNIQRLL